MVWQLRSGFKMAKPIDVIRNEFDDPWQLADRCSTPHSTMSTCRICGNTELRSAKNYANLERPKFPSSTMEESFDKKGSDLKTVCVNCQQQYYKYNPGDILQEVVVYPTSSNILMPAAIENSNAPTVELNNDNWILDDDSSFAESDAQKINFDSNDIIKHELENNEETWSIPNESLIKTYRIEDESTDLIDIPVIKNEPIANDPVSSASCNIEYDYNNLSKDSDKLSIKDFQHCIEKINLPIEHLLEKGITEDNLLISKCKEYFVNYNKQSCGIETQIASSSNFNSSAESDKPFIIEDDTQGSQNAVPVTTAGLKNDEFSNAPSGSSVNNCAVGKSVAIKRSQKLKRLNKRKYVCDCSNNYSTLKQFLCHKNKHLNCKFCKSLIINSEDLEMHENCSKQKSTQIRKTRKIRNRTCNIQETPRDPMQPRENAMHYPRPIPNYPRQIPHYPLPIPHYPQAFPPYPQQIPYYPRTIPHYHAQNTDELKRIINANFGYVNGAHYFMNRPLAPVLMPNYYFQPGSLQ